MDLKEHYNTLYQKSVSKIKAGKYEIDKLIDSPLDKRRGITVLFRPDRKVKEEILSFMKKIKLIEPHQYFYREPDLHVTVMSIISCYDGFELSRITVEEYIKVIQNSIQGLPSFEIEFKGITASPSCIIIQGFFKNNTLNQVRDNLRINFKDSDLEQSIDKRYAIQTAHSTVLRIKDNLLNTELFLNEIEGFRDYNFGTFTVNTLELVFNDWYQKKENVKTLAKFKLQQ